MKIAIDHLISKIKLGNSVNRFIPLSFQCSSIRIYESKNSLLVNAVKGKNNKYFMGDRIQYFSTTPEVPSTTTINSAPTLPIKSIMIQVGNLRYLEYDYTTIFDQSKFQILGRIQESIQMITNKIFGSKEILRKLNESGDTVKLYLVKQIQKNAPNDDEKNNMSNLIEIDTDTIDSIIISNNIKPTSNGAVYIKVDIVPKVPYTRTVGPREGNIFSGTSNIPLEFLRIWNQENGRYIDKTGYIHEFMANVGNTNIFFTRPRKFGKSYLLQTVATLLKTGKQQEQLMYNYDEISPDIWKGLAIRDKYRTEGKNWVPHLVVMFNFGFARTSDDLLRIVKDTIYIDFDRYLTEQDKSEIHNSIGVTPVLSILFKALPKSIPKAVIIDEYDATIINGLRKNNYDDVNKSVEILQSLFSFSKSGHANHYWVTGIARFSKESLFSSGNNFFDATYDQRFSKCIGLTEDEIIKYFPKELQSIKERYGIDQKPFLAELSNMYNGYCFDNVTTQFSTFGVIGTFTNINTNVFILPDTKTTRKLRFRFRIIDVLAGTSDDILIHQFTDFNASLQYLTDLVRTDPLPNDTFATYTISTTKLLLDIYKAPKMDALGLLFQLGLLSKTKCNTTSQISNDNDIISNTATLRVPNDSARGHLNKILFNFYTKEYSKFSIEISQSTQQEVAKKIFLNQNKEEFENWVRRICFSFPSRSKIYLTEKSSAVKVMKDSSPVSNSVTADTNDIVEQKYSSMNRLEVFYQYNVFISLLQLKSLFCQEYPEYQPSITPEHDSASGFVDLLMDFGPSNPQWFIDFGVANTPLIKSKNLVKEKVAEWAIKKAKHVANNKVTQAAKYAVSLNRGIGVHPRDIYAVGIGITPSNLGNHKNMMEIQFTWTKI